MYKYIFSALLIAVLHAAPAWAQGMRVRHLDAGDWPIITVTVQVPEADNAPLLYRLQVPGRDAPINAFTVRKMRVDDNGTPARLYQLLFDMSTAPLPAEGKALAATLLRGKGREQQSVGLVFDMSHVVIAVDTRPGTTWSESGRDGDSWPVHVTDVEAWAAGAGSGNAAVVGAGAGDVRMLSAGAGVNMGANTGTAASVNTGAPFSGTVLPPSLVARYWPWLALFMALIGAMAWILLRRHPAAPLPLILDVPELGRSFSLKPGTMVLGASPHSDIHMEHPGVAGFHAELCVGKDCRLLNRHSRNVLLNGRPVKGSAQLRPGDVLKFGDLTALVRLAPAGGALRPAYPQ